jgi:EAL domain-containing protein (putative c-di-GMP-specific phosphodiesterase class I)
MENAETISDMLKRLDDNGIRVYIADFGVRVD